MWPIPNANTTSESEVAGTAYGGLKEKGSQQKGALCLPFDTSSCKPNVKVLIGLSDHKQIQTLFIHLRVHVCSLGES